MFSLFYVFNLCSSTFCCLQSSPSSSPTLSPKRSSGKKKYSHPDLGLSAIQESSHDDSMEQSFEYPTRHQYGQQMSTEESIGTNESHDESIEEDEEEEDDMVRDLRLFADKHYKKQKEIEQNKKLKEKDMKKSKSQNTLLQVKKTPLCKTVSEPGKGKEVVIHSDLLQMNNNNNMPAQRDRACSDPEVDTTSPEHQHKEHKHRRLSMKGFKFGRKKGHVKAPSKEELAALKHNVETKPSEVVENGSDKENDSDQDIDEVPLQYKDNFLRRMSVKVKSMVTGKDKETDETERKESSIKFLDLTNDEKDAKVRVMTYSEICAMKGLVGRLPT